MRRICDERIHSGDFSSRLIFAHHCDFRLMDRKVVDAMAAMPERDRFVRGLVSWTGFRQVAVPYRRAARFAGYSKYPLSKMVRFAIDVATRQGAERLVCAVDAANEPALNVYRRLGFIEWAERVVYARLRAQA